MPNDRVLTEDGRGFVNGAAVKKQQEDAEKESRLAYINAKVPVIMAAPINDNERMGALEGLNLTREEAKMFPNVYSLLFSAHKQEVVNEVGVETPEPKAAKPKSKAKEVKIVKDDAEQMSPEEFEKEKKKAKAEADAVKNMLKGRNRGVAPGGNKVDKPEEGTTTVTMDV